MKKFALQEIKPKQTVLKQAQDWRTSVERQYEKIVKEMKQISENSKQSVGMNYYIMLNYKKQTDQHFLRWRSYGNRHIHLTWEQIEPLVLRMGDNYRNYYLDANKQINFINAKEVAARCAIRLAKEQIRQNSDQASGN